MMVICRTNYEKRTEHLLFDLYKVHYLSKKKKKTYTCIHSKNIKQQESTFTSFYYHGMFVYQHRTRKVKV